MRGIKAFFTVLFVMPLGHAVTVVALKGALGVRIGAAVFAVALACILIYATKYMKSPAWTTFVGMIAGVLVWAGVVEIGVKLSAEAIELGEQRAMEFTLAIIIPLVLYLLFSENVRCNFFISLRKGLRILKGEARDIPVDNWGPPTAFKMFTMIWMGHILLFFTYDEDILGPEGLFCKVVFVASLIGGTYLFYRLTKAEEMGFAFRYAMPTVIVVWTAIEILVKWDILSEPWLTLNPLFLAVVAVAFVGVIVLIVRAERRKKLA